MSISYEEALDLLKQAALDLQRSLSEEAECVDIRNALGRVCSEDVCSTSTLPPFDNSAMDGFAVTSSQVASASPENPIRLEILGSIAAGDEPPQYDGSSSGLQSYRINTGAAFPIATASVTSTSKELHFDACARIEDVRILSPTSVEILKPVKSRQHRRLAGEDYKPDMAVVRKGRRINPGDIAALVSNGIQGVTAARPPRIAILVTGKELDNVVEQAESQAAAHIFDSNSHYVQSSLREWGYSDVEVLTSVGDEPNDFKEAINSRILGSFDVLVTTGGVSKGQHDYVKSSLQSLGADITFHGSRIRPGHPALFAQIPHASRNLAVFGLPGNPVATAACLRFLVSPFLRISTGLDFEKSLIRADLKVASKRSPKPSITGACGSGDSARQAKAAAPRMFLLGRWEDGSAGQLKVELVERGSGMVRPMTEADCWIMLREDQEEASGVEVACYELSARPR